MRIAAVLIFRLRHFFCVLQNVDHGPLPNCLIFSFDVLSKEMLISRTILLLVGHLSDN